MWAGEPDRWLRPFCAEEEEGQMTPRRLSEDEACDARDGSRGAPSREVQGRTLTWDL